MYHTVKLRQSGFVRRPVKVRWVSLLCVLALAGLAQGQDLDEVPKPDQPQASQETEAPKAQESKKPQESQKTFDTLTVGRTTFSNVTIVTRTATHISFQHAQGFATVKMIDLLPESQTKLGYTPPPPRGGFTVISASTGRLPAHAIPRSSIG